MFVSEDHVDNFILKASDTVYKYVEQNIYKDRKQTLPEVSSSSIKTIENTSYSYNNKKDNKAYEVVVNLEYKKDLGYPTEIKLILIHNDKKLEIAEMK